MQTINKLSKYKDIADLVYLHLHRSSVKDMIKELNDLAQERYVAVWNHWCAYPLFSDDHLYYPCFNYRLENKCEDEIYHISHKDHKRKMTNVCLPPNTCTDKKPKNCGECVIL